MNSVIKIMIASFACSVVLCSSFASADTYISDKNKTTAIDMDCNECTVIESDIKNGAAFTEDGFLILSPNANGTVKINDGTDDREINVAPPVNFDFEDKEIKSDMADFSNGEIKEETDNVYLDGMSKTVMQIHKDDINRGCVNISYDLRRDSQNLTKAATVLSVKSEASIVCELKIAKKSEQAYFQYKSSNTKYTSNTNVLLPFDEWIKMELMIDFTSGKMTLKANENVIFDNVALFKSGIGFDSVEFTSQLDNLSISSGNGIDDAIPEIGIDENTLISDEGIVMLDPQLSFEFGGAKHTIDAKYCNLSVSGTDILSVDGKIAVNTDDFDTSKTLNITAECIISGKTVKKQKEITVTKDKSAVTPILDTLAVMKPSISDSGMDTAVDFTVYNYGKAKKLIAAVSSSDGGFAVKEWELAENAGKKSLSMLLENAESDTVKAFLIDTDTFEDLFAANSGQAE